MDDHAELADEQEDIADRLEAGSKHNADNAEAARAKLDAANNEALIPEALGKDDPGYRGSSEGEKSEDAEDSGGGATEGAG